MSQTIMYCFRNRLKQSEEQIRKKLEEEEVEFFLTPTYCMKLCMFCENLNVAIVNREIVMEKNNDLFISKILERLE